MSVGRILPLLALLAACGPTAVGVSGRWTGSLTPTKPDPACPGSHGVAQVKNGQLLFVPDEGTWVLNGTATPDGTVTAQRTRPGANKQPYVTRLTGTWTQTTLDGVYTIPACTYAVHLIRPSP